MEREDNDFNTNIPKSKELNSKNNEIEEEDSS